VRSRSLRGVTEAEHAPTHAAFGPLAYLRGLPVLVQDGGTVAVLLLVQFVALASSGADRVESDVTRPIDAGAYGLILLATVPLVLRRRVPYVALAASLVALLALAWLDYGGIYVGYSILVGLYSVSAHRGLRGAVVASLVTIVALFVSYQSASWEPNAADSAFDVLAIATAVALGDGTRSRMRLAAEQAARLAVVDAEQERIARQTVLDERTRIARELHDLVAHSMSIVAVQAGVGHYLIDRDPAQAKEALATIETTSRQALTEMRRMLGVLRVDTTEDANGDANTLEPQPGSNDIAALVAEAASSGLDVRLVVEPGGAMPDVPSGVALSAYRIVQEALTNVRKHAGPASVTVTVRSDSDRLTVTVDDDGRGVSTMVGERGGFGLVGMRERATVLGGDLTAGPRPGGGFRVHATLPIEEGT
jgi:signal transduction histidine kinase